MGFVACDKVCGSDIFKAIRQFIRDCGLDINMCRGQGYDGAGGMAGALEMPSTPASSSTQGNILPLQQPPVEPCFVKSLYCA